MVPLRAETFNLHKCFKLQELAFRPRLCLSETRFLYTIASERFALSACGKPSCTVALVGNPPHVELCGPGLVGLLSNLTPAPPQFARLQIFVGADMCLRAMFVIGTVFLQLT